MALDFERSGATVPLERRVGLPDPSKAIRLADGRVLVRERRLPENQDGPPGSVLGGSSWSGPMGLQVIVTLDHADAWGPLLHVSVSYAKLSRMPTWDDITAVKDAIFGDVDACMILPKREDYVNVRPNCFQLWQTPERWGMR